MKTITKLLSGLFIAVTLMMGFSQNVECKSISTSSFDDFDVDFDDLEWPEETNTKSVQVINRTNLTFQELNMKTNLGDEYKDLIFNKTMCDNGNFGKDFGYGITKINYDSELRQLGKNMRMTCSFISFETNAKTVDFEIKDTNGKKYTVENVDISNFKNKDKVTFEFTGEAFSTFTNNITCIAK